MLLDWRDVVPRQDTSSLVRSTFQFDDTAIFTDARESAGLGRKRAPSASAQAISDHQHAFFQGHSVREMPWPGPVCERVPNFYAHEFAPGPRFEGWTYTTVGVWAATHDAGRGLEFVLSMPQQNERAVELLAMLAFYHAGPGSQRLDLGHTVPIGEPWLPGSTCNHMLMSQPFPYGPDLEHCAWPDGHARHLWLLPISEAERAFKVAHGVEALEQLLEAEAIIVTDPHRPSVVPG